MCKQEPRENLRMCKKCNNNSVSWEGNWELCLYCGEVYRKKHLEIEKQISHKETQKLDNIVLDININRGERYLNKARLFLSA